MATHQVGESGGVLVFSENPETVGELLTLGRELASRLHRPLIVVAVGRNDQALLDEGLARGADEVLAVRDLQGDGIVPDESIATALCEAICASTPAVVLVGATRTGAELAACAAQMLQIPCASSCVSLEMDDAGNLRIDRRVYGGRFVSRQLLNTVPRMATVPPKRFPRAEKVSEFSWEHPRTARAASPAANQDIERESARTQPSGHLQGGSHRFRRPWCEGHG